jgi:hypothetical protein
MSAGTMTYTGTLTITSCWCGIHLAIPEDLHREAHRDRHIVFCPLGHEFIFGEGLSHRATREHLDTQAQGSRARRASSLPLLHYT